MAKIFLSCAFEDEVLAESVQLAIEQFPHSVFFYKRPEHPAAAFYSELRSNVRKSDIFVFLLSPDACKSGRFTVTEIGWAQEKWPRPRQHVLPVLINGAKVSDGTPYLRSISMLKPAGSVPADVAVAVEKMAQRLRRGTVRRRVLMGLTILLVLVGVIASSRLFRSQPAAAPRFLQLIPSPSPFQQPGQTMTLSYHMHAKQGIPSPSGEAVWTEDDLDYVAVSRVPDAGGPKVTYLQRWSHKSGATEDKSLEGTIIRQSAFENVYQAPTGTTVTPAAAAWIAQEYRFQVEQVDLKGIIDFEIPAIKGYKWVASRSTLERLLSSVFRLNPITGAELDAEHSTAELEVTSVQDGVATFVGVLAVGTKALNQGGVRYVLPAPLVAPIHVSGEVPISGADWSGIKVDFTMSVSFPVQMEGTTTVRVYGSEARLTMNIRPGGTIPGYRPGK